MFRALAVGKAKIDGTKKGLIEDGKKFLSRRKVIACEHVDSGGGFVGEKRE